MIGTNHVTESGFMDELPFKLRDAAIDLITFYRLNQLILMHQTGPTPDVKKRFTHTIMQWDEIFRAVILTKISYFTVTMKFPITYINKLVEVTAYALDMPGAGLSEIYQNVERKYPFFARWLKTAHEVKLKKYQLAKLQQSRQNKKG